MDRNRRRARPLMTRIMGTYTLLRATGATREQVKYWRDLGLVVPAVRRERAREEMTWTIAEGWVVHRMKRLVDAGVDAVVAGGIARRGPGVYEIGEGVSLVLEDFEGDVP